MNSCAISHFFPSDLPGVTHHGFPLLVFVFIWKWCFPHIQRGVTFHERDLGECSLPWCLLLALPSATLSLSMTELTWMIWAAASGVPCLKSWPFIDRTLSFRLSFPFLAAKPPSKRSRMKIPASSVFLISLIPKGSDRSLLTKVTWITSRAVELHSCWAALLEKPFSCSTMRCRTEPGWRRKETAWQ